MMLILNKVVLLGFLLIHLVETASPSDFLSKFNQNDYKLSFERIELISYNKTYLKDVKIVTFKYNRTTAVVNYTMIPAKDFEHFHVVVQAYKFVSNEYRMFPMRYLFNYCDGFDNNIMGIGELALCGNFIGCPYRKDIVYFACNFKPNESKFPPLLPSGSYLSELTFFDGISKNSAMKWHFYGTVYRPLKY